jgi:hypothetical protein
MSETIDFRFWVGTAAFLVPFAALCLGAFLIPSKGQRQ